MDEVVPDGNLELVVGLIQIFVEHLNEGFLGIEFSLVVLRVDVDLVSEILCLGDPHDFAPVSEQFFLVKVDYFVLTFNFGSKDIFFHLGQFL